MKAHNGMRPQDILILMYILAKSRFEGIWSKASNHLEISEDEKKLYNMAISTPNNKVISRELEISESEVSESLYRSEYAGFIEDVRLKKINRKAISLHRYITKCPDNYFVDHINRDTLDNRRSNLRVVTPQENSFNTSCRVDNKLKTKGVCKKRGKFLVQLTYNKKRVFQKTFESLEEANQAYLDAAQKYHKINPLNC